jgi:hypothetical protein
VEPTIHLDIPRKRGVKRLSHRCNPVEDGAFETFRII